jgi:phosphate-selective porin OprO/OprP
MPSRLVDKPTTGKFGPGFEFKSADEEFVLQFHDLTQVEFRGYQQGGQNPTHDTFAIPRQWWIFSGRITKPWEYFLSFQNGFDTFSGLDIFLNAHYDDRVQLKVGRFKTPFAYEFYTVPIQGTISPELSLFYNNFGLNRSVGGMVWGRLFNETAPLDYAVGMFNADPNSFLATSDAKTVTAFVNWRPFATWEGSALENFVFGGSVLAGTQTFAPIPSTFRTVVATAGNAVNGVPFLTFNANARESGPRAFWDLHAAWYYQHLSLIAEWQSGYQDYALSTSLASHDRIGVESYYVQMGYFITGETVSGRNIVRPLNDFDIRHGKYGIGAIEPFTRFNSLNYTRNIFSSGLADPNLWTSNLYTAEAGLNWYLNQYVKLNFTWQHAVFGNPVQDSPTMSQKTSDLFLLRFQLFF